MPFAGWEVEDFEAVRVPGFEARMAALRARVRPKLETLAVALAPELSTLAGEPLYPHVARHARRTVNPPDTTWCSWSRNPRGYKKHPHFQLGIWPDHLFLQAGVIREAPFRPHLARLLEADGARLLQELPPGYFWKTDHTEPRGASAAELRATGTDRFAAALRRQSSGGWLVGADIERDEALALSPPAFAGWVRAVAARLVPAYRLARRAEEEAAGTPAGAPGEELRARGD